MSRKKLTKIGKIYGIGDRIKKLRVERHLTQGEFADLVGVKTATISRYEHGRVPDEETLKKIANYLGTTVEWLLHGEEKSAASHLHEHAPETYVARPSELNIDYLVRANFLTRRFLKIERLIFTDRQEAQLSAYIFEYLNEFHADPGEVVIRRLADLIQRQKQEG